MNYVIEYAAFCHIGKVRAKNQDNFWCMGKYLDADNAGLDTPLNGVIEAQSSPAFAVFDGMGGEQQGEIAAYIAADTFNAAYKKSPQKDTKRFLLDVCADMNKSVCAHAKEQHIRSTGSTAAILMFGKNDIYICNVGDSRIYQFSGKELAQISRDHSETSVTDRKPPLTQNLGIPETDFIIEPYVAKGIYDDGDRYLICSDGLTDMVPEKEIAQTLSEFKDVRQCAEALMQKALESGGNDNITLILCEIRKQKRIFGLTNNKPNQSYN